jgi:hypothetical protein
MISIPLKILNKNAIHREHCSPCQFEWEMSLELVEACIKTLWIAVQSPETAKSLASRLQEFTKALESQAQAEDPQLFPENRTTDSYAAITAKFGDDVTLQKLILVAYVCANAGKIKYPTREEKRRKSKLLQWFEKNWDLFRTILPEVQIEDDETA